MAALRDSRPFDPAKISFAPECFEVAGFVTEWVVQRSAVHSGPARFHSLQDAEDYARRTGREVHEVQTAVRRRVRWF